MASALMSMSESVQTSIIIQRQLNPKLTEQPSSAEQQQQPKGISVISQLLLVPALFGIEMVIAFEQIYQILFHQFLGVPVSLLSINGIVCGAISVTLLPLIGYFSDKGANPKKRKIFALIFGMSMFLCGLILLAVGGFIKLEKLDSLAENITSINVSSTATYTTTHSILVDELYGISSGDKVTTSRPLVTMATSLTNITHSSLPDTGGNSEVAVTAILSIIGFSLIDIGFDMSISLARAFILESAPKFQHTRLLVMSTASASIAGTTFSMIGCFDFPGALEPLFHVEGVAVTLIFFCALLICVLITGYSSTIITGHVIHIRSKDVHNNSKKTIAPSLVDVDDGTKIHKRRRLSKGGINNRTELHHTDRRYVPDILHTEEGDSTTRPLLLEDSLKSHNYSTMSLSTSSIIRAKDIHETMFPIKETNSENIHVNNPNDNESKVKDSHNKITADVTRPPNDCNKHENISKDEQKERQNDNEEPLVFTAVNSNSMSMSVGQSPLGEFYSRKLQHLNKKQLERGKKKSDFKVFMNKRLVILCLSCFFTFGALVTFTFYISNALNIGIFHGDPTALPGTVAYDQYQAGLRIAALGNLVLYITYMVISLNNTRIIKLIERC
uniref:Uncharacterized protein n=1 Tax=Arion vulgaris TaxID=1028688 RepID=A0A0B7A5T5_9EUPU